MHRIRFITTSRRSTQLLFLVGMMFLTGCGRSLRVIDESGLPVVGAEVVVVGLSTSGTPSITNEQGVAHLINPVQKPMGISIRKEGVGSTIIAYPSRWPVEVTLRSDD